MPDADFCSIVKIPKIEQCMTMAEWAATWQGIGIALTLMVGIFSLCRFFYERNNSQKLERVKFFLDQHRRLFDDEDLKNVLQHIDGDSALLAGEEFWERNRKFLVFIEEIQLLIQAKMLDSDACQYMFGYYAAQANRGENFRRGINFDDGNWDLFVAFAENYDKYKSAGKKVKNLKL